MEEDNYKILFDYSLKLLSFRPRSRKEMEEKLKQFSAKRKFSEDLTQKVIDKLTEQKIIDDKEFVRWWIEQRQTFRPKGARVIKLELLNKGIEKETIENELNHLKTEGADEFETALSALKKKLPYLDKLPSLKRKIKIRDFLFRRGFEWEAIRKVIDYMEQKE